MFSNNMLPFKNFANWSLRWKLLSIILGATALGILLSLAGLTYSVHNIFKTSAIDDLTTLSKIIGQNSSAAIEFNDKRSAEEYLKSLNSHPDISEAAIYNDSGRLFVRFSPTGSRHFPQKLTHSKSVDYKTDSIKLITPIVLHDKIIGSTALMSNNKSYRDQERFLVWTSILIFLGTLILVAALALKMQSWMSEPIVALSQVADKISLGELDKRADVSGEDEIGKLAHSFNLMVSNLKKVQNSLERQNLIKSKIAAYIKDYQEITSLSHLAQKAVSDTCKIIEAGCGAFYILSDNEKTLELTGSFALGKNKRELTSYDLGEGLVGQCAVEREFILLTEVPPEYMPIASGLGEKEPLNILTFPILYNKNVCGVLELGSFHPVSRIDREIVEEISATLGIIINNIKEREKTTQLLQKSQRLAEELQAQQEELKSSNEELEEQTSLLRSSEERLKVQSEELQVNNEELELKTKLLSEQKNQLEKTTADIQAAKDELEIKARELLLTNKYKSEFLANMSHELRTPLNSLLILAKLLMDNSEENLNEDQVESARIIYGSGKDLLNLINDILDLSKVEAGKLQIDLQEVNPKTILRNVSDLFIPVSRDKNMDFQVEFDPNLPPAFSTDSSRVEQILKNLLSNAFKFTDSGRVRLKACFMDNPPKHIHDMLKRPAVVFSVEDTGIGIPDDKQSEIFKAFQQLDGSINRKYGGTGLGLTISRELAKLLDAQIDLESREGEGSCFRLYLPFGRIQDDVPVDAASPPDSDSPPVVLSASGKNESKNLLAENNSRSDKHILLIEDNAKFANVLKKIVEKKGHFVLHAGTGKQGLEAAQKNNPLGIILDLGLPDMSGLDVLESLRSDSLTAHIPIYVISGRDEAEKAMDKGAIGYFSKPIENADLEEIFARFEKRSMNQIRHILLVEDDGKNQMAISKLLKEKNIHVTSVSSGKEALEMSSKEHFDGIILDLGLPDMTGFQLIEKFKGRQKGDFPSLIIYTGKNLSKEEYHQLREHTSRIIIKGSRSPERLRSELQTFLRDIQKPNIGQKKYFEPGKLLKGKKILLVDDDLRNNFALSKVLEMHGMHVLIADNGELALKKLREENNVDLVLMDIMMPVMDGYEAIRQIRNIPQFKKLPVLALTAKAMQDDRRKALEIGASDYLTKPVDPEKLINIIRLWVFR